MRLHNRVWRATTICRRQHGAYKLRVRKVFPEVRNKSFKTEFVSVAQMPPNLRAGTNIRNKFRTGATHRGAVHTAPDAFYTATGAVDTCLFARRAAGREAGNRHRPPKSRILRAASADSWRGSV